MFTGIIESTGRVSRMVTDQSNIHFLINSDISNSLSIDQSVSHNGVCLTVTKVHEGAHWVTAIDETLRKSDLGNWQEGTLVNLERCMLNNGRFDGHIVQGHVDQVGVIQSVEDMQGSWQFVITYDQSAGNITVEKGSVSVNGVSLTCFNSSAGSFSVAIIPYTYEHTNFKLLRPGDRVNLEFDIIGKYVKKLLAMSREVS